MVRLRGLDTPYGERSGLSLLEVILALAILALSMAAIGELIRIGTISAARAEDQTQAQILAESKLAEIMAGAVTPDPVTRVPFVTNSDWFYSIDLAATEETEVMALTITVETHIERARPLAFSLVRWIPDPGIELPDEEEQPEEETEDASDTTDDTPSEIPDEDDIPNLPNGFGNGPGGPP